LELVCTGDLQSFQVDFDDFKQHFDVFTGENEVNFRRISPVQSKSWQKTTKTVVHWHGLQPPKFIFSCLRNLFYE